MAAPSFSQRFSRFGSKWGWWLASLFLLAVLVLLCAPMWAADWIKDEVEQQLENRLGLDVELGEIDLNWKKVAFSYLQLSIENAENIRLHQVEADISKQFVGFLNPQIEVEKIRIDSGVLAGNVEPWLEWFRSRRASDLVAETTEKSSSNRRVRLRPKVVEVAKLSIEKVYSKNEGSLLENGLFSAQLHGSYDGESKELSGAADSVVLESSLTKYPLKAGTVSGTVPINGESKLHFELQGASTQISEHLAVAGVGGSIEVSSRNFENFSLNLSGGFSDSETGGKEKLWTLEGTTDRALENGSFTVQMQDFRLGQVPEVLSGLPLVESELATVGGLLQVAIRQRMFDLKGKLSSAGLNILHPILNSYPIRNVGLDIQLDAEVDPKNRLANLKVLNLQRNGVEARIKGRVEFPPERERRKVDLEIEVPPVECQRVLDAIPSELVPGIQGFRLRGDFQAKIDVDIDFSDLEALRLDGSVSHHRCRVLGVPALLSDGRLTKGFVHRVAMRDGRQRNVPLYRGSPGFTSYEEIAPSMTAALLTTEDGSFWRHRGFLPSQFANALRRNLKEGEIRLGASTLTMQMVKNVLLSHERTLARKLQEMVLTWYVERALSKERILEIYLNAVEFGPGIYGITNASRHYFAKSPSELTSLESAYMAMMLPSPVRRHIHYCRGQLSDSFERKLRRIHGWMFSRGHLPEAEYELWKDSQIEFNLFDRGDEGACVAEIDRIMKGKTVQRALSGLLRNLPEEARYRAASTKSGQKEAPELGPAIRHSSTKLPSVFEQ